MLKKLRKMLKQQEGFTLVELMIVVVILGIISGIGIQQYGNVQKRAKEAANDANVRIIISAANMFLMAEDEDSIDVLTGKDGGILTWVQEGYLEADPSTGSETYTLTVSPWGEDDDPKGPGYRRSATGGHKIEVTPWFSYEQKETTL